MTVILLLMHIFWSYFLYNTLWKGMKEKSVVNNFDTQNKKWIIIIILSASTIHHG